jgi:nucleoside-diphosphate-sugar epimerase
MKSERILVTGATGMIGSFVARRAVEAGYNVRVLARKNSDRTLLQGLDVEYAIGDLADQASLPMALEGVDVVVHAAAHIGDWGPAEIYRQINVVGLEHLLTCAMQKGQLRRWVQVSSLGVYPARDHFGTDEETPPSLTGLDGYTRTKAEAEIVLKRYMDEYKFPATILRPGFTYGPGERAVIPRLLKRFDQGIVKFLGNGMKLLNNTYVGNFVDAVLLAIDNEKAVGQTFNIRDQRLVTRVEYLTTVASYLGKPIPRHVPLGIVKFLVPFVEGWASLIGSKESPVLTRATIKFMAMNLDFSIDKATSILGYAPAVDFQQGMPDALEWATGKMKVPRLVKG